MAGVSIRQSRIFSSCFLRAYLPYKLLILISDPAGQGEALVKNLFIINLACMAGEPISARQRIRDIAPSAEVSSSSVFWPSSQRRPLSTSNTRTMGE